LQLPRSAAAQLQSVIPLLFAQMSEADVRLVVDCIAEALAPNAATLAGAA